MKIPKYVDTLINQREKYAIKLLKVCRKLDDFIIENDIECETFDTLGGCEIYANPSQSASRIRGAILDKEK